MKMLPFTLNFNTFIVLFLSAAVVVSSSNPKDLDAFGNSNYINACLASNYKYVSHHLSAETITLQDSMTKDTPLHILVEQAAKNIKKKVKSEDSSDKILEAADLVSDLVNAGAKLDAKSDSDWTPLNKAIYLASDYMDYPITILKTLLKGCVAINERTNGSTPLHLAAGSKIAGRAAFLVKTLMDACDSKIKYEAIDSKGKTALEIALLEDLDDVIKLIKPKTKKTVSIFSSVYFWICLVLLIGLLGLVGYFIYIWMLNPTEVTPKEPEMQIHTSQTEAPEAETEIEDAIASATSSEENNEHVEEDGAKVKMA